MTPEWIMVPIERLPTTHASGTVCITDALTLY